MTKYKKQFDEKLQETRSKTHDKIRFRRRKQQEHEAEKELKDYENRSTERPAS